MSTLTRTIAAVQEIDSAAARAVQDKLDGKTKPRRSLGRLEDLACQVAAARRTTSPAGGDKSIVVMAADHGVADEGVSAFPADVTAQMLLNFVRGGAAINALARQAGASVVVVDMGVRLAPADLEGVRSLRIAAGTRNLADGPAMTRVEAAAAIEAGIDLAGELAEGGVTLLGLGDMGIGNTTAASALTAAFTGLPPEEVTGRGTGVDDAGYARKLAAVRRGLAANRVEPSDPLATLAALGGLEIAGLVGVALGAAARQVPVVVDGFPTSVAALCAARLCPAVQGYLIPSHRSVEIGHGAVLRALGLKPLLDLDCRLGEGTGAALAMTLVDAALRLLDEMATFESAGVSDSGPPRRPSVRRSRALAARAERGAPMLAPSLMIQGTASSVGKSLLAAGLCRLFRQEGLRVLPFKSQNMALNAFVTPEGGEISRAQAVQAEAAGVAPHVDMNPILLKPESDRRSQVIVLGRVVGAMTATEYHACKPELRGIIAAAIERLRRRCDVLVIEGAGSPAEINLKAHEIVNMHVARAACARVLLVGDIDKGGVFAALLGTLELLEPDERALVAGFLINKFRGDPSLLTSGLDFLAARTGVPVLGVLPYLRGLRIADEDSVSLDHRRHRGRAGRDELEIAVVRLPRISNYDDVQPLEHEPGLVVRFVDNPRDLAGADLVVLPGSKSTATDLSWLRQAGLADAVVERAGRGELVLGLCGGCEMLGAEILDPEGVESNVRATPGLGLLPLTTRFARSKVTAQVVARPAEASFLTAGLAPAAHLRGYEIHMGRVERTPDARPAFDLVARNGEPAAEPDGAVSPDGAVVGTMLHGIFEDDAVRAALLCELRRRRGLPEPVAPIPRPPRDTEYDRLAAMLREHVDLAALRRIAGLTS